MKMIDGIPQIIEGISYYAHVGKPVADYAEKTNPGTGKFGWELNLAVSDEVFEKFQRAGFNVGLRAAGRNKYTEDNVITFYKYLTQVLNDRNYKKYAIKEPKNINKIFQIDKWSRNTVFKKINYKNA